MRVPTSKHLAGMVGLVTIVACHAAPPPAAVPVQMPSGAPVGLSGIVQDLESYSRLSGTTVELALVGNTNQPIAVTVTDEHGNFSFGGVPAGVFMLHIGRQGYTETRLRVEVKSAGDKPTDVRLRPIRGQCPASRYHMPGCP